MPRRFATDLPQILSITSVKRDGSLVLKKVVRRHLGLEGAGAIGLRIDGEVRLTSTAANGMCDLEVSSRGKVTLPGEAWDALGGVGGGRVALLQRPGAVAIKRIGLDLVESPAAAFSDVETATTVVRRVEMNPLPDAAVPALAARAADLRLGAGVGGYLRGRESFHAWCARRELGEPENGDAALRESLIDERMAAQLDSGAWGADGGIPIQTARVLRELAELGVGDDLPQVRRAVGWLLDRPESVYNPGQWFGSDDLVAEQAGVMDKRMSMTRGTKPRFRQIKVGEQRRVVGGDDLIVKPCGPRIMWPNGIVLEALLRMGCEAQPRVREALDYMLKDDWCECGYQNGNFRRGERAPFCSAKLDAFELMCIDQYRYAGLQSAEDLLDRDMAQATVRYLRVSEEDGDGSMRSYGLEIDRHIQGCEFITTRSLASACDPDMRRFAEAHLWRFAGIQLADGLFPAERYGSGFGQIGIMEAFARYPHHPITPVVILKSLPWLVETQRADGSWTRTKGPFRREEPDADATTRAVVKVLKAVEEYLPDGFWG